MEIHCIFKKVVVLDHLIPTFQLLQQSYKIMIIRPSCSARLPSQSGKVVCTNRQQTGAPELTDVWFGQERWSGRGNFIERNGHYIQLLSDHCWPSMASKLFIEHIQCIYIIHKHIYCQNLFLASQFMMIGWTMNTESWKLEMLPRSFATSFSTKSLLSCHHGRKKQVHLFFLFCIISSLQLKRTW